jgi:aminoglycoside phosphotransferase (APT) family kinase protein
MIETGMKDQHDLVDFDRLTRWMDEQGLGRGPLENGRALAGGTQNILLEFQREGRRYVLRRPPRHPRADGNETMRREIRVLTALATTSVPHAPLIAACPSEHVLGAAFYLMEPVEGFNPTVALPPLHAGSSDVRRRMGFALLDGLLELRKVDYMAAGLDSLGRSENFLSRQVERWKRQLQGYSDYDGWPGHGALGPVNEIAAWLDARIPANFRAGIMHGDYHLANVMYRLDGPQLAAIVDWELATIGDPLVDLGWVLATWPDEDRPDESGAMVVPWEGFPSPDELIGYYAAQSGGDLSQVKWYTVFACYKLAIIIEGTHARACAGKAQRDVGERLHRGAAGLLRRAARLIL